MKKRPKLRNSKEEKRDKVLQVRLSAKEFRAIRDGHGKHAAAVARMCLLGHEPPPRTALESEDSRKLIHALYAYFGAAEKTRYWIRQYGGEEAKAALVKEDEAFNHLARICYSSF
ncbi:MAG: hypothetical protein KDN05_06370 [Verrucomicrobiae bacterium]|nr:hypothetical protein [Verrucomicrobiae bacterium]MCP5532279.1 hypothetical protein [Akkermansiaceae bacterium]